MSIREDMKRAKQEAVEELQSVEFQIESSQKTARALKLALNVLSGEPRAQTKCRLSKHYTLTSGYFQKADCSECGQTVQGWEKSWRFCPKCGSLIERAETEESPNERMSRNAAREVFANSAQEKR